MALSKKLYYILPIGLCFNAFVLLFSIICLINAFIREQGAHEFAQRFDWLFPPFENLVVRNTSQGPFQWTHLLWDNYKTIFSELEQFQSANQRALQFPQPTLSQVNGGGWTAFYLRCWGHESNNITSILPRTMQLVREIDEMVTMPMVMISVLAPGQSIKRHRDFDFQGFLRYQLSLSIPPHSEDDLYLAVYSDDGFNPETKEIVRWSNGSDVIFDQTKEHEVINRVNRSRILLMVNFLRDDVPFWLNLLNEAMLWVAVQTSPECPKILENQKQFLEKECPLK